MSFFGTTPDPTTQPATPPIGTEATSLAPARAPRRGWRAALLSPRGIAGLSMIAFVVLLGIVGPWLSAYDATQQLPDANLLPPSGTHWLGTNEVNRDVFARLLAGIRVDLVVVLLAVPVGALVGTLLGLVSTLYAAADVLVQRVFDVVLAFPVLILAIGVTAARGPGVSTIIAVIVLAEIPVFGRLARTSLLTVRSLPYVESAQVIGAGNLWLLRKHLLPNSLEPLVVQLAVSMSVAVFIEGAMSFLGLGVRPPQPSLGSLTRDGIRNVWESPVFVVGPLVVVTLLVLGFLLLSQAVSAARRA